ncbi:MAG TPA: plastocyanin/azurin family copper-binding protein [Vicinamibacterales bacterium]|nr:plastocyanin/azurin family copper-binding protein [Vicinamibacterales bacterium]
MKLFSVCVLAAAVFLGAPVHATQGTKPAPAAGGAKPRTIELTGDEKMKYDKEEIAAKPGETIRIVLKAVGQMPKTIMAHNFVLLKPGVDAVEFNKAAFNARETGFIPPDKKTDIIAATALAGAGETVEVTFKAPAKPGSYNYICSFPGHFAMGMRGKLVVK